LKKRSFTWGTVVLLAMTALLFWREGIFDFLGFAVYLILAAICVLIGVVIVKFITREKKK